MNTIIVLSHLGLGDNILNIPLVNYLSQNNKVELVCKKHNAKNMEYFFRNNKNVSLYIVNNDSEISPKYNSITNGKIVYASGSHTQNSDILSFPFFMYNDVGININIMKDCIYENTEKSNYLYNIINNHNYIFLCNNSSDGEVFNINNFLNENCINSNDTIIICSNKNYYDHNHKFYDIAQYFVYDINKLLILDYKQTIENALINVLTDSSLFCFAIQLQIKSNNNFLYTRPEYRHLNWNKLVNFFNKKFFII